MGDPVILATKLCFDYYSLDKESYANSLTPDVEFSLHATIFPPGGPSTSLVKELRGKDEVMEFLDIRHFCIVEKATLQTLGFQRVSDSECKSEFVSNETKMEGGDKTSTTYKYIGSYVVSFNDDMKVSKISLRNERFFIR